MWFRMYTSDLKMHSCQNNSKKSYTEKIYMNILSGYSLFTQYSFDATKNKHDWYRGQDCTKSFCKDLKKHVTNNKLWTNYEENKCHKEQKVCHICKKDLVMMMIMMMMMLKSVIK